MRTHTILRREWFGGLLVHGGEGQPTVLDHAGYARARQELAARSAGGGAARLVDAEEMGYPLRNDALSTPGVAYVELTKRCNGACTHCYANATPAGMPDELSCAEWVRVFSRLAAGGAYYVRLSGGEPTLRQDLPDLLDLFAEKGLTAALNTHGRFDEPMLLRLLEHGVRDLRLSVDGTEAIHDAIRGPGTFRAVLATLRRIADYNRSASVPADPTMNVVLMKPTRHCIAPLAALAAELQCKISFGLLRPAGRASRALMLSPAEVVEAAREVAWQRQKLGLAEGQARINFDIFCDAPRRPGSTSPFPFDNSKCPIGTLGVGITATGRLMPCNYMGCMADGRWVGESVREHDILDLWQTSQVLNAARRVRRKSCSDCVYYRTRCNGGCPATAYAFTGDLDGRDPYCVRDVPPAPVSVPLAMMRKVSVPSLLRGLRTLGVYADAEWAEFSRAFVESSFDEGQSPGDNTALEYNLAGRIERGQGARAADPDFSASPRILRAGELARLKAQQGLRLGVVSGAYDLLHLGHVRGMRFARERLGSAPRAALCALTLADEAIRAKKGTDRPVLNLNERLALLSAVRWLDYVVPLEQPDCLQALELLEPEYYFKSPADLSQTSVRQEIHLVARGGGVVSFLPTDGPDAVSTTRLVGQTRAPSAQRGIEAPRIASPSESLRRLLHGLPAPDTDRFPEALYEAALAEAGLPRPPAWPGTKCAFLITFDGPSGVGKDTQLRLLHRHLRNAEGKQRPVLRADLKHLDPFRPLQKHLWENPEFSGQHGLAFGLLTCGRRYALDAVLGQWLSDPANIILQNRSFLSHVAYHAMSPAGLDQSLAACSFDPRADVPLVLDCDPGLAFDRVRRRSPEKGHRLYANEQPDFIARVQRNFAELQRRMGGVMRIDTTAQPGNVAEEIARVVTQQLARQEEQP